MSTVITQKNFVAATLAAEVAIKPRALLVKEYPLNNRPISGVSLVHGSRGCFMDSIRYPAFCLNGVNYMRWVDEFSPAGYHSPFPTEQVEVPVGALAACYFSNIYIFESSELAVEAIKSLDKYVTSLL